MLYAVTRSGKQSEGCRSSLSTAGFTLMWNDARSRASFGPIKTTYGDNFAKEFGFLHHDLEDNQTLNRFNANPAQFIGELLNEKKNVVVTWGFGPDCERSVFLVQQLRDAGFKWIWFDGNRTAALREFQKRATVPERNLHVQMHRIEQCRIVERLKPTVINSFDDRGQFKPTKQLLAEIRASRYLRS